MESKSIKRWGSGAAFLASGLVAGGVLASSLTANAATTPTPSPSTTRQAPAGPADPGKHTCPHHQQQRTGGPAPNGAPSGPSA